MYSIYPKIQPKSVFYFSSDTSYYGSTKPSMPFQTGFGRTLLVWYGHKNADFPREMLSDTFLYFIFDQGYKDYENYGFGYYNDFISLTDSLKTNNLNPEQVYAFEYSGKDNILVNSTSKVRAQLSQKLIK